MHVLPCVCGVEQSVHAPKAQSQFTPQHKACARARQRAPTRAHADAHSTAQHPCSPPGGWSRAGLAQGAGATASAAKCARVLYSVYCRMQLLWRWGLRVSKKWHKRPRGVVPTQRTGAQAVCFDIPSAGESFCGLRRENWSCLESWSTRATGWCRTTSTYTSHYALMKLVRREHRTMAVKDRCTPARAAVVPKPHAFPNS